MRVRVVSWNVHGCVGTDGRFTPERPVASKLGAVVTNDGVWFRWVVGCGTSAGRLLGRRLLGVLAWVAVSGSCGR